jgi:hypothetical protein
MHGVEIPADNLEGAARLDFTFYFPARDEWRGKDFAVELGG